MNETGARRLWAARLGVVLAFALSRVVYLWGFGVRFETGAVDEYMQLVDPKLLREDLFRSLWYLRDQPPLFNLGVGLALKAFPHSFETATHGVYLSLGLVGALATFELARRLGRSTTVAAGLAAGLACVPGTVLYEHWLFYGYPIAVLLLVATLALHALLSAPTAKRAAVFFGVLSAIVLTRGTFHWVFYVAVLAAVLAIRPPSWKRIAVGALVPSLLVAALYVKHAVVFHGFVIGGFYRGVNAAMMQMHQMPERQVQALRRSGRISSACPPGFHSHVDLRQLLRDGGLESPPKTGIPVLDETWKSTGATNWASSSAELVGVACAQSSAALHEAMPNAYAKAVFQNVNVFVLPADQTWPFLREQSNENAGRLAALDHWSDKYLGLQPSRHRQSSLVDAALVVFFLGAPLVYWLRHRRVAKKVLPKRRIRLSTSAATVIFAVGTVGYASAVVILFSTGDHNRYREEIMPVVWVVAASTLAVGIRALRRRSRARPGRGDWGGHSRSATQTSPTQSAATA